MIKEDKMEKINYIQTEQMSWEREERVQIWDELKLRVKTYERERERFDDLPLRHLAYLSR